jgi:SulP family sulfate permease
VALSLLLQLNREALDLTVVELAPLPDGRFAEQAAPASLLHREVVLLDVYGSLYYAGARTLAARLPDPLGATAPVVVLRLRGRTALGVTSFKILTTYAQQLGEVGGRLYLSGVTPELLEQFKRAEATAAPDIDVFPATGLLGESSSDAYAAAVAWRQEQAAAHPTRHGEDLT